MITHTHIYIYISHTSFEAFVHTLYLLTDKKIAQYRPIVDTYLSKTFHYPTVHKLLVKLALAKINSPKQDMSLMIMSKVGLFARMCVCVCVSVCVCMCLCV